MARKRRLNAEPRRTAKRQHPRARKPQKEHAARPPRAEPAVAAPTERAAAAPTKPAAAAPIESAAAVNPFAPMERLMQAFMPMSMAWLRPWLTEPQTPKLDVIDRNGALIVRAEVPGIDKNDLAVEASDIAVTIKGEIRHTEQHEDSRYRVSETSHGTFERTVRLPADVDSARAKATFKDGVLEVMLPKVDRSRPHPLKL